MEMRHLADGADDGWLRLFEMKIPARAHVPPRRTRQGDDLRAVAARNADGRQSDATAGTLKASRTFAGLPAVTGRHPCHLM